MAKINVNDLLNKEFPTNKYGIIKVLDFIEKTEKDYIYKVLFKDTNNIQDVTRASIKRGSCVDDEYKKQQKKEKSKQKTKQRLKMNEFKEQQYVTVEKNNFKTLSLDQSTTGCAYSIFIDNQMISFGKVDTKQYDDPILKIIKIRDIINEIIKKENIDLLVIEDIYIGYNANTYKTLAILYGVLEILAYENDIIFISQTAYQWKKGVGLNLSKLKGMSNRRDYQKRHSIELANKIFHLDLEDDDISDSLLIGYHTVNNCFKKSIIKFDTWA